MEIKYNLSTKILSCINFTKHDYSAKIVHCFLALLVDAMIPQQTFFF